MARHEHRHIRITGQLSQKIKLSKANVLVLGTGGAARGLHSHCSMREPMSASPAGASTR